jgi:outer membrane receptor protein involved in Fe transport
MGLYKPIRVTLFALTAFTTFAMAGTTGKISGVVTAKSTHEPLVGMNVVVKGTTLGTATDLDGRYTIINVPPGTYELLASGIGYRKTTVKDVRVFIDQTARVDVALEEESVEVGEIVITAERRALKKDVATSVVAVSSEEIASLPVSSVTSVVGMQAGIQGLTVRGSSWEQLLFQLDGITMRDPRNNQPIASVALSTIREISIERGGFNAEYGQVQSGIVNVITNEGRSHGYYGSIHTMVTPAAPKYYRGNGIPDVQSLNSYWLRPYFDPAVCWTGTNNGAWDQYTKKEYLAFEGGWNAVSNALLTDDNPNNDLTPLGAQRAFEYEIRKGAINNQPDYDIDGGFGGPVPFISEELGDLRFFASYRRHREILLYPMSRPDYSDYDGRVVVNSDITSNLKLTLSGIIGNIATMAENWNYGFYPRWPSDIANGTGGYALVNMFGDMAYSISDIGHRTFSAKLTHTLSPKSYYEVFVEYLRRTYFTRPPQARDLSALTEVLPGFFETSNPLGYYSGISDGIVINQSDQQALARDNSRVSALTVKADVTYQLDFRNLVKTGAEFVYNDLDLDYGFIQMQTGGLTYANHIQMRNYPVRASAFIQDKLEAEEFTLNAGLRLDYSNSRTDWWSYNPYDPSFYSYRYATAATFPMVRSEPQWQLSPRLGISHPITENSKLYFNYGHFKQMPQYETLFRISRRSDNSLASIGNPNLMLAKTISYELGYDHELFDRQVLIQVSAFYRDITNQQNTTSYNPVNGQAYAITTSNTYGDIRGFELTLRKSAGRWINGFGNLTYQTYSGGNFGAGQIYEDVFLQQNYNENSTDFYQTHSVPAVYARLNLNMSSPSDFGPAIWGHNVFGDILLNLLLNWQRGGWTTYNPLNSPGVTNNVQYVDYFDGTLRASKMLTIRPFTIQLFADISNLFNARRLRTTSDQDYQKSLHLPKSNAYTNIPGDDKFGDYRTAGVDWIPEVYQYEIRRGDGTFVNAPEDYRAIYYEGKSGQYWQVAKNSTTGTRSWVAVDQSRLDQINKDKAYIFMPNPSTFWFLNPRNITLGLTISFNFD